MIDSLNVPVQLSGILASAKLLQTLCDSESLKSGVASFLRFCEGVAETADHPAELPAQARIAYEARHIEAMIGELAESLEMALPVDETFSQLDSVIDSKLA